MSCRWPFVLKTAITIIFECNNEDRFKWHNVINLYQGRKINTAQEVDFRSGGEKLPIECFGQSVRVYAGNVPNLVQSGHLS